MRPSLLLLLAFLAALCSPAAAKPPNIVFILADDLGWTDLACQGSKYYETPNIDRLAAEGVRFTRYYNCPNCQPTRAALLSGQYPPRTGVYTVGGTDRFDWHSRPLRPVENVVALPLEKITVAQTLKNAGYATGMFGKWHLGEDAKHHPKARGFDEAIVSMGNHFNFATSPKTPYPPGTYLADFLTDQALDFIRRQKDQPFFLYLPHFGVHSPHQAKDNLVERFKAKPAAGGHHSPVYAAMIASIDESVGRVMALLDELKLAGDTVVIFSGDNGGVGGYDREGIIGGGTITDNAPLRSGKGSLYEGGIRDPFIVRWPGVTKPATTTEVPATHVDIYPTLIEIAAARPPADYTLDGESLVPLLRDPAAALRRDAIYQHFPGYLGARQDTWRTTPVGVIVAADWKLMEFFEDHRLELYNLREDIGEKHNLAQSKPEKVKELHAKMIAWRESIKAPMPAPNTDIKPAGTQTGPGTGKRGNKADE
jgi:arylsulfatase A-like enzyme